jgi:hypothetical protein
MKIIILIYLVCLFLFNNYAAHEFEMLARLPFKMHVLNIICFHVFILMLEGFFITLFYSLITLVLLIFNSKDNKIDRD